MSSQELSREQPSLRSLIGHAVLTALCPLIPIPFLDDWIRDVVRRRMVRELLAESKSRLSDGKIDILACGYEPISPSGCMSGCVRKAFKIPINFVFKLVFKKILRKIVFVLAIKDSVDTFSATFHEGFLLQHALAHEPIRRSFQEPSSGIPQPRSDSDPVIALRRGIEAVRDEVDHRPVERWARKTFTVSKKLLKNAAKAAARQLRRSRRAGNLNEDAIYDEMRREETELGSVVDELTDEIGGEQTYLRDLQRRLDHRLGVAPIPTDAEAPEISPSSDPSMSKAPEHPVPEHPVAEIPAPPESQKSQNQELQAPESESTRASDTRNPSNSEPPKGSSDMASAPSHGFDAEIDHLVWATPELEAGVAEIGNIFSTEPVPGGSHPGIGTRNALLGLENQRYFEVLAPDPNQSQFRSFGRWMEGLSTSGLLSWAGRSSNLEALAEAARSGGLEPGKIESMSRQRPDGSSLSWKLMMIEGHDFGRLVPFFIEWADFHPSQSLQPVASLESLQLSTPNPQALEGILKTLGMESDSIRVVEAGSPGLTAELSVGGRRIQIR